MLLFRNVEQSVRDHITSLFVSPTNDLGVVYNVYGEDSYWDDAFTPVYPYVWLLGVRVRPRKTKLPLLILDVGSNQLSYYEVGTRAGTFVTTSVHIFANTRGERDDLAAFLYKSIFDIPIYDYNTTPATLKFHVQVEGLASQRMSIGEEAALEGSLNNWDSVQFSFQLLE